MGYNLATNGRESSHRRMEESAWCSSITTRAVPTDCGTVTGNGLRVIGRLYAAYMGVNTRRELKTTKVNETN